VSAVGRADHADSRDQFAHARAEQQGQHDLVEERDREDGAESDEGAIEAVDLLCVRVQQQPRDEPREGEVDGHGDVAPQVPGPPRHPALRLAGWGVRPMRLLLTRLLPVRLLTVRG
jgi:hypothetical protein